MIGHQAEQIEPHSTRFSRFAELQQKPITVGIVIKDSASINATDRDVINRTLELDS